MHIDDYFQPLQTMRKPKTPFHRQKLPEERRYQVDKICSNTTDVLAEVSDVEQDKTKEIMSVFCQKWNVTTDDCVMFPQQQFLKDAAVYTQKNSPVWYPQFLFTSACCLRSQLGSK